MTASIRNNVTTFIIVAGCSLFFCSKGVFVKQAYAHGADTITILALRMAIALPFFALAAWGASRKAPSLTFSEWIKLAALGFIGYYFSSVVNFHGLRYVSVGLERIVLFTYPSIVLLGSVLFLKQPLALKKAGALALAYGGIVVAFLGEAGGRGSPAETALGVGLVFASALSYAFFITVSGEQIRRIGTVRFTSIVVGFSCLYILIHYGVIHDFPEIATLPSRLYVDGGILAIFGTVVPSFLMGFGLKRAGATQFAVIGTIGPVGTVVLAWLVLGEGLNFAQVAGFALSLAGGLAITLQKQ